MPLFRRRSSQPAGGDLPNTPAVAVESPRRQYAEIQVDPLLQSDRWFVVSLILAFALVTFAAAFYRFLPLKTVQPYIVEAAADGEVARVTPAKSYTPTKAMIKSSLASWAQWQFIINAHQTQANLKRATSWLRGKAAEEQVAWMAQQRHFERLVEDPTLVRTVEKLSVDSSQDGIAFIFLTTQERGKGGPVVKRWRLTVQYSIVPPQSEAEILDNPAGLAPTHFEFAEEQS